MDYWLATAGKDGEPSINGAIMEQINQGTTYNSIDVPSVDEFVQRIVKEGVFRRLRERFSA